MKLEEYNRRLELAIPHGPNEPCTCNGCHEGRTGCDGRVKGCTCDIDWDAVAFLRNVWIEDV